MRRPIAPLIALSLALSGGVFVFVACVGDEPTTPAGTGTTLDSGLDASNNNNNNQSDSGTSGGDGSSGGGDTGTTFNDGGDASGVWSPSLLDQAGSLALWLEATSADFVISNGKVGTWKDRSKFLNSGSNSSDGPSVDPAVIHNHDAVHFTEWGLHLTISDTPSLRFARDQVYIAAVAKVSPTATGSGFFFSKVATMFMSGTYYSSGLEFFSERESPDGGPTKVTLLNGHVDYQEGNTVTWGDSVFDDGKFHLVTLRRPTPDLLALTVDNQTPRTAPTSTVDISQDQKDLYIGSIIYGEGLVPTIDFEIAELVVVHPQNGVLADADVTSLHDYLMAKYGL